MQEKPMRQTLINTYLDYVNNYLSLEVWAEHNGLSYEDADTLLTLAKDVMNSNHPES